MSFEVINNEPISLAEMKEILEKEEEPDFRVQKTMEYLNEFVKISADQARELKQKISSLGIVRLSPEMITKFVDILPRSEGDIKSILSQFNVTLTKEQIKDILNIVSEYL